MDARTVNTLSFYLSTPIGASALYALACYSNLTRFDIVMYTMVVILSVITVAAYIHQKKPPPEPTYNYCQSEQRGFQAGHRALHEQY